MSDSALTFDLLVIGWGKAGKTLAKRYATTDDLLNGIWTRPSSTEALNEVLAKLSPYPS